MRHPRTQGDPTAVTDRPAPGRRTGRRGRHRWAVEDGPRPVAPAALVVALAVLVAAGGLWFAVHGGPDTTPRRRTGPSVAAPAPAPTPPSGPTPPAPQPSGPAGGPPPVVGPVQGTRPTAAGMSPPPDRPVNPADPGSVAAHAAADACSYTWTESLAHATARVTRWMTPAAAAGWRPTAGDRAYWTGHVVPTHETVSCRVTAVTTDGPETGTARGISVTLTTDRASSTAEEHGVGSYAVLVGRRSDRTWRVRALTVTG